MLPVLHRKAHLSHSRFWEYREVNGNNYSCHFLSLLWTFILLASVGILFFFCMIGSLFSDMLIAILCWPVEKSSPCILFVSWGYHGLHWLKSVPFILSQSAGWQELWVAYELAQNLTEWKLIGIGRCIVDPSRIVFEKHWLRIAGNVFHESLARHLIYRICEV